MFICHIKGEFHFGSILCLYSLAQCALDDTSIKLGMQLEQVVNALFSHRATADLYLIVKKWMSPLSIDLLYVMKKILVRFKKKPT